MKAALVHLDATQQFEKVIDAIRATPAETTEDLADLEEDEAMTRRALDLLGAPARRTPTARRFTLGQAHPPYPRRISPNRTTGNFPQSIPRRRVFRQTASISAAWASCYLPTNAAYRLFWFLGSALRGFFMTPRCWLSLDFL